MSSESSNLPAPGPKPDGISPEEFKLITEHIELQLGIKKLQIEKGHEKAMAWITLFRHGFLGLCAIGFAYVAIYLPVSASHGEITHVTLNYLASIGLDVYVAWGATAASGVGAYAIHKRRKKDNAQNERIIRSLRDELAKLRKPLEAGVKRGDQ